MLRETQQMPSTVDDFSYFHKFQQRHQNFICNDFLPHFYYTSNNASPQYRYGSF